LNGAHVPLSIPRDLITFSVALLASLGLTVPIRHLALRFGMVDKPGPRKVHIDPIPLLGGIAIYLGFVLAVLLTLHDVPLSQILGILAGATLLAAVGFLDDGGLLHHQVKLFIGMPAAALFLIATGIRAQFFSHFFPGTLSGILGITAAFSILDHMDGLCAGIAAVAAAFFTISAGMNGQTLVRTLGAATFGAALGFLRWNFNPAKIFMGDGGAMFLGFLMATLGLKVRPDSVDFPVTWLVPVLILGVPIFDTTLVSISRSRRGLLPFTSPGKDHTAHRLSNLGLGHRGAVLVMYAVAAVFGSLALLIQRISPAATYAVVGVVVLLAFVAILYLENLPYERQVKVAKPAV
jgi:UDP-GlcNAc:undecaprenyl-phosphate GlcNAc-1-phosphate transferase